MPRPSTAQLNRDIDLALDAVRARRRHANHRATISNYSVAAGETSAQLMARIHAVVRGRQDCTPFLADLGVPVIAQPQQQPQLPPAATRSATPQPQQQQQDRRQNQRWLKEQLDMAEAARIDADRLEEDRMEMEAARLEHDRLEADRVEAEMLDDDEADADALIAELVMRLHSDRAAAGHILQHKADDIGVPSEPDVNNFSAIFPLFAYDGTFLDGPAEVIAAIKLRSPNISDKAASENAHRCYQFAQALTPYHLVQRVFHLWLERPIQAAAYQVAIPPDQQSRIGLLHQRLDSGRDARGWHAVTDVFFLAMLGSIYTPRWKAEMQSMLGTRVIGSPEGVAKNRVRTQIAGEMLGTIADSNKVTERANSLLKQVKCGEFINDTLNGVDASLKVALIAVIPWEKMVKRGGAHSKVSEVAYPCLWWMMSRMMDDGVIQAFLVQLARLVAPYIRPGVVFDHLAPRPITPTDQAHDARATDTAEFQAALNVFLVRQGLHALESWTLAEDPIDAVRGIDGYLPSTIYWDCTLDVPPGEEPSSRLAVHPTSPQITDIGNVETDIPDNEVSLALMALTGPGCQYAITCGRDVQTDLNLDANWSRQWIVVMRAPVDGNMPDHTYSAVVLLDLDMALAVVRIISPVVGARPGPITQHCQSILDPWLIRCNPDFTGNIEYAHYALKKRCRQTARCVYSIGATMLHTMAVMTTGHVYDDDFGRDIDKVLSRRVRERAKQALTCRRDIPDWAAAALEYAEDEDEDFDGMEDAEDEAAGFDGMVIDDD